MKDLMSVALGIISGVLTFNGIGFREAGSILKGAALVVSWFVSLLF